MRLTVAIYNLRVYIYIYIHISSNRASTDPLIPIIHPYHLSLLADPLAGIQCPNRVNVHESLLLGQH